MQTLKLPKVGQGMEEGTVVEWTAAPGDRVAAGDVILLFESDKATNELTADEDGVLIECAVEAGETVPVGTELGRIAPPEADAESEAAPETVRATPSARRLAREHGLAVERVAAERGTERVRPEDVRAVAEEAGDAERVGGDGTGQAADAPAGGEVDDDAGAEILGTPRARVVAAEHGISVEAVGRALDEPRVREADVETYLEERETEGTAATESTRPEPRDVDLGGGTAAVERTEAPAPVPSGRAERGPPEGRALSIDEEIGPMFDRMAEVARTYASTTTVQRVDVTDLLSLRDRLREAWDDPLPTTALVVRAAADCLPDYPLLNAAVEDEEVVRTFEDVNVGVAVDAGDRGLLVPTVYDADELTLRETGREVERLSTGAREGTLDTADLRNGTFTVSNAGGLGAYINTPMINPPQTAVLGVCAVVEEPAFRDGEVVPRKRLHLCLTYDHRVVAGADAVGFLSAVRGRLETPETLLS